MSPERCNSPAVSVTPARRTPSIDARNSWVIGMMSSCSRSRAISSQRAHRCSIVWSRLHAAVLCAEIEQGFDETYHDGADSGALIESCLAFGGVHPQRTTGNLDKSLLAGRFSAKKGGRSNSALDPDHPDFDRRGVRHFRQDRDDPFIDEIDMRERRARLIEHLSLD